MIYNKSHNDISSSQYDLNHYTIIIISLYNMRPPKYLIFSITHQESTAHFPYLRNKMMQ